MKFAKPMLFSAILSFFLGGPTRASAADFDHSHILFDKVLKAHVKEALVHFAIVCAAYGCPPLRSEAYVADKLDAQLDDQGRKFLGTANKNSVDARARALYLSPIFKWFSEDFEKKSGTVQKFVAPFF